MTPEKRQKVLVWALAVVALWAGWKVILPALGSGGRAGAQSASLGGGSSDAGAVLRALAALHPGLLDGPALARLALGLGADVPFFLDPRPAWVRGIGEEIEPLAGLPTLALLLAHPGISLATAAVYAEFDRRSGALTPARSRPTLRPPFGSGSPEETFAKLLEWLAEGQLWNDLEAAAVGLCPEIRVLRDGLERAGARAVGMSGSGATVFGVFGDLAEARAGMAKAAFGPTVWVRVAATAGSR